MKNQAVIEAAKALTNDPESDKAYQALFLAMMAMDVREWPEVMISDTTTTIAPETWQPILIEPGFTINDVRLVTGE